MRRRSVRSAPNDEGEAVGERTVVPEPDGELGTRLPAFSRVIFIGVVVAAGLAGVILVSFPGSTARLFAWPLGPPSLAAIIGGLYLGSAASFAIAVRSGWAAARGLAVASIVFTVPTFIATLAHLDLFDFGRLIALDWIAVFAVAPVLFAWMLVANPVRGRPGPRVGQLAPWLRGTLGLVALALLVGAVWLWIDPPSADTWLPLVPKALGGRFLGSWMSMIATLVGWAAVRPADEGRPVLLEAAAFLAGGVVGAVRGYGGLQPGDRVVFVGVLVVLAVGALLAAKRAAATD